MTKLTLIQAERLMNSLGYSLEDASVWTETAILEEAENMLQVAAEDPECDFAIVEDDDGPIAITKGNYYVVCIDHAYYDHTTIWLSGTKQECEDYLEEWYDPQDTELGLASYDILYVPAQETNTAAAEAEKEEEVIAMNKKTGIARMEELAEILRNNQKTSDAGFIKRDDLRPILNKEFNMGFKADSTRKEMVAAFFAMYKDAINVADEIAYGNMESDDTVENVPQQEVSETGNQIDNVSINDDYWNVTNATEVLEKIIEMAQDNDYISFISHHMATSAITEVLFGKKLVDPITKVANEFTNEEKRLAAEFRSKFAEQYLIANKKGTGYNINSLAMSWHYKKCIYRWKSDSGQKVVDYIVDYNAKTIKKYGVANAQDNKLDEAAFKKIDATCKFVKVAK